MSDTADPNRDPAETAGPVQVDAFLETIESEGGGAWRSTIAGAEPGPCVTLRGDEPVRPATGLPVPQASGIGRYQLLDEIARGGMGAVIRGRDTDLNRDLAVKVLLDHHRDRPEVLRRFFEEAQIGGQLQHPGIVPVYELGTFPDKRPFFAMKLVKGQTLAALLEEGDDGPAEGGTRFLLIFEHVAQTVAYAHSRGVIHRDLKPQNIMVGTFGEVQVMDWGLAKVLSANGHLDDPEARARGRAEPDREDEPTAIRTIRSDSNLHASVAGSVMGTPAYMAPEQALGMVSLIDERADVFGLGAILCEILTGEPAYSGTHAAAVLRKAESADLADAFARLDACGADPELIALARSCLAPKPGDRPRDASVVAKAMTEHRTGVLDRLRAAELARVEADAQARAERIRRKYAVALTASVAIAVLVGAGSLIFLRVARDHRIAETDRTVGQAMANAETLLAVAKREGIESLDAWNRALAAAEKARDVLSGRIARPGLEDHVTRFAAAVAAGTSEAREHARKAAKGHVLIEKLEEAELEGAEIQEGSFAVADRAPAYAKAFRDAKFDLETMTPEEAAALSRTAARSDKERVAAVLDDWARLEADPRRKAHLLELARTVDPDPLRGRLREALISRDRAKLAAIARSDAIPAGSLVLLANALTEAGAGAEAMDLLVRGQERFPGDFWINQRLGSALGLTDPPRWDEAVRYLTAAVALKPQSAGASFNLGLALFQLGRYEESAAALREATRIKPDFAEAYFNLGICLRSLGRYREALEAMRRGDGVGSKRPGLRDVSAAWVKEYEALLALESRLPALLSGELSPVDPSEGFILARMCANKSLYAASARFYAAAIAADPRRAADRLDPVRYRAAVAAIRAGSGSGRDEPKPDAAARADLRSKARGWLQEELSAWKTALETGPAEARAAATRSLSRWLSGPDLAPVRDAVFLVHLPRDERAAWLDFWADVEALRAK